MRTLWSFRSGGVAGATSGVNGAVLTSAQTLAYAQQLQAFTNIGAPVAAVAATQDNTTATFATITGTSIALAASSSYLLDALVSWSDPDEDAGPSFKMDFTYAATMSGAAGVINKRNDTTLTEDSFTNGLPEVFGTGGATSGFVRISGICTTTTAGTLALRFAQQNSTPGVIIRTSLNTYLSVRKIR